MPRSGVATLRWYAIIHPTVSRSAFARSAPPTRRSAMCASGWRPGCCASTALARLAAAALNAAPPSSARASKRTVAALLAEGIARAVTERQRPEEDRA